jgi:hypothetical protein
MDAFSKTTVSIYCVAIAILGLDLYLNISQKQNTRRNPRFRICTFPLMLIMYTAGISLMILRLVVAFYGSGLTSILIAADIFYGISFTSIMLFVLELQRLFLPLHDHWTERSITVYECCSAIFAAVIWVPAVVLHHLVAKTQSWTNFILRYLPQVFLGASICLCIYLLVLVYRHTNRPNYNSEALEAIRTKFGFATIAIIMFVSIAIIETTTIISLQLAPALPYGIILNASIDFFVAIQMCLVTRISSTLSSLFLTGSKLRNSVVLPAFLPADAVA